MKKLVLSMICGLFIISANAMADIKFSGLMQAQFEMGQQDASLTVGTANENPDESFNRFGIRRGRLKAAYTSGIFTGVFQVDGTEKGFSIKDIYANVKIPFLGQSSAQVGLFPQPFGWEISYSSGKIETPERSMVTGTLFPSLRDVGAILSLQTAKGSALDFMQLDLGILAGNAAKTDVDSKKDFLGRLSAKTNTETWSLSGGISGYYGFVYQGTPNVYTSADNKWEASNDSANIGEYATRQYFSADAQFSGKTGIGTTTLRGEVVLGQQPGTSSSSTSPNAAVLPSGDTYIRNFMGGYAMLVQSIGELPVSAVIRFDLYDPNTKMDAEHVQVKGDVSYNTLGFGAFWNVTSNVRLTAFYGLRSNEKCTNYSAYSEDLKDNTFTFRLQYSF